MTTYACDLAAVRDAAARIRGIVHRTPVMTSETLDRLAGRRVFLKCENLRFIRDKKGFYKFPDPKFVVGSNFCDIGFDIDDDNRRIVALSASDNLMKGAAGSAIQNMNVMYQYDEKDGLNYTPLTPV